jgi:Flp pilus assembly protein TadG
MRQRQSGIVLIVVVIGMLAVLAMAGLALDTGHLVLEKSRLQNAVDAAALTGAKVLDQGRTTAIARTAALDAFDANAAANGELGRQRAGIDVQVEFSSTLRPFAPGSTPPRFVRVRAENLSFASSFVRVVGIDSLVTRASAVAGPTPLGGTGSEVCDVVPMLACADPGAGAPHHGLQPGQLTVLKIGAGGEYGPVGPGNFQLLDAGSGARSVRDALAGKPWRDCASIGDVVATKPGNNVGPVEQGFNARFESRDPLYPPDVIASTPAFPLGLDEATGGVTYRGAAVTNVSQIGYSHAASYEPLLESGPYDHPPPTGVPRRREVVVPLGVCTGTANGTSNVTVLGFGCFFLLQPTGHSGHSSFVVAEYFTGCTTHGTPGNEDPGGGGPDVIQLYRDYSSQDS